MSYTVDAKGLACPQPVILTKKALEHESEVSVLVDNTTALENVKRLAESLGCLISTENLEGGIFKIDIKKGEGPVPGDQAEEPDYLACSIEGGGISGPSVTVISSDKMGSGDDELGIILMKAFLHTQVDLDNKPDVMIFYNAGVKLTVDDSPVLDDLQALAEKGTQILVCGTCANYYELTERVSVGIISNMYDIAGTLSSAGRIVKP